MTEEGFTSDLRVRREFPKIKTRGRTFDSTSVNHPVPDALKHTTSPLSAAMFIFAVGTAAKAPSIRAWWRARRTIGLYNTVGWRHAQEYSRSTSPVSSAAKTLTHQTSRGYSTIARKTNNGFVLETSPTRKTSSFTVSAITTRPSVWRSPSGVTAWNTVGSHVLLRSIATVTQVQESPDASDRNLTNFTPAHESSELLSPVDPTVWENLSSIYLPDVVGAVAEHLHTWPSVQVMEQLVHSIHDSVGLPWWGTIMLTTFLLRATVLPIQIAFMKHQLRVKKLQPQLAQLDAQLNAAATPEEAKSHAKEILKVLQFHKARPLVQWWTPILFPPYFLSWFACVHNQALGNPDLLTGGLLWFVDLTATDPTFLLPVMACLSWLGIVEMGASALYLTSPRLKMWTRFTALAMIPVMSTLPCAVFCFWIPSNLWEIGRIMLFNTETVRTTFRIPLRSELPPVQPVSW